MRLRAKVVRATRESPLRTLRPEEPEGFAGFPPAVSLEIDDMDGSGGYFLFRFDADGDHGADTWHETVDGAKREAEADYGVAPTAWVEVRDSSGSRE